VLTGAIYRKTEYHEAGHAVMAWLCGWRLRKVSTVPDADSADRCDVYPVTHPTAWDYAVQARFDVDGGVASALKLEEADTAGMRYWVARHDELPSFPDRMLDALLVGVRDDLQANWPRVEALAAALQDRWWLWGKRATAVIEAVGSA
jgi:hypothetical protein